ncbi:MAG: HPr family phosphocarrier protein [Hespellia sp.]|nr:HPr family phosphocarrier protein [Hespellia sp.]
METTMNIRLKAIDTVKDFVNDLAKFEGEFDLISGRYVIDAKSIMGIFSLDLSNELKLSIKCDDENCVEVLKKYKA